MTGPPDKDRKVLLVVNNFPPVRGGSAVVYDNLARHGGGRVMVLAPRISYTDGLPLIGWREHDRKAPFPVRRLKLLRTVIDPPRGQWFGKLGFRLHDVMIRLRLAATVLWLIAHERIGAVCLGELLASGWLVGLLGKIPGVTTLVYIHGEEITTDDPYDPGHHRRRHGLLGVDHIIVVSRFTLGAVRRLLGAESPARISLIENGVDTARFRPAAKRADLLRLYRLEGAFVFVSVCRLLEKKGIDQAIRALAEIAPPRPDIRLLVVGQGPYRARLEKIAREAGIADKVVFTGLVPGEELVDHYCLGDVFVMPNRALPDGDTEGFGLVFLEANSCGLPVIAGRDGGSTDAVADGVNGIVVDGGSVAAIAGAMARLHDDADLRETLRRQGLATAAAAGWEEKSAAFLRLALEGDAPADKPRDGAR